MSGYSAYTDGAGAAPLLAPSGPSLTESSASELWNLLLENRTVVPFSQFIAAITKHFNQVYKATLFSEEGHLLATAAAAAPATGGYTTNGSNSVPSLLNAALAATGAISDLTSENPTISREAFLLFLARFGGGASKYSIRDSPFDAVRQLFPTASTADANPNLVGLAPWFHASADLPSNVEPVLQKSAQAGQGNFILRFSGSKPSHFAMDFIQGPNDSKAKKLLIVRQGEGWMKQGGQTVHPTLPVLIDNHARSNGQWIVSALSQRFKGGEAIESSTSSSTSASLSRQPSATQGAYSTTGLENAMQGVQILDASLPNSSPALSPANSGYAAAPIVAEPAAPVAASGYAASFNPVAAPVAAPAAQSGYSASFIAAESDALPSSNPGGASRAASTLPPLPSNILAWNQRVLFYAAAVGDLLALQQHCARCEGCALTDAYGLSLIHVAAANDQPEVLKLLKSHVPETLLRSNITRAISPAEATSLSAYNWNNRYMPYWPSKALSEELAIANPRALCAVFNTSKALAALEEMGVQPSLLLERAPSTSEHSSAPLPNSVPILTQTLSAGASRYMAQ